MASNSAKKPRGQKRTRNDVIPAHPPAKRIVKAANVTIEGDTIVCRDLESLADSRELLARYSCTGPNGEWIGPNKVETRSGSYSTLPSSFWERSGNQPDNTITKDEIETLTRIGRKLKARAENAVGELETARREVETLGQEIVRLKEDVENERKEKAELREEVARLRGLTAELKLSDAKTQAENAKLFFQVLDLEKVARSSGSSG